MPLSKPQKSHLRALGHHLKPVVWVGQHGLRDGVLAEIDQALDAHELIKVKLAAERETRGEMAAQICAQTGAEAVQRIGQIIVLFRRNQERPKIALPAD
jgi:RNA-binding protein